MTSPVTVAAESGGTTIWGHTISDLQTSIAIADHAITGTLKYVDSGVLARDWGPGNFIALKFTLPDGVDPEDVKVGLDPSMGSGLVALDNDKNGIFKVTDKDGQVFVVEMFNGAYWTRETYDLSGLTCNAS